MVTKRNTGLRMRRSKHFLENLNYNDKTVLLRETVHQISRGESAADGLTAVPVMSKIQNSINIYPWIWRRLTCPTQDFGNP